MSHGYVCPKCSRVSIATITEQFQIGRRLVTVTLCMRCWLEERKGKSV